MKLLSTRKLHVGGAKSKILVEKKTFIMDVAPVWSNGKYPQLPRISPVLCIKTCCHANKSIQDLKLCTKSFKVKVTLQQLKIHFWISVSNT